MHCAVEGNAAAAAEDWGVLAGNFKDVKRGGQRRLTDAVDPGPLRVVVDTGNEVA